MKQILILSILLGTFASHACECMTQFNTKEGLREEWNRTNFIMELLITEVVKTPKIEKNKIPVGPRILKAIVQKLHKGNIESDTIEIFVNVGSSSCESNFELDKTYLFYGVRWENNYFHTTHCTRTGLLVNKDLDLKWIAELKTELEQSDIKNLNQFEK